MYNHYYVIGPIFLLMAFGMYLSGFDPVSLPLPIGIGIGIIGKGVSLSSKIKTEDAKRDHMMATSVLYPGLVQFRYSGKKSGILYLLCYYGAIVVQLCLFADFIDVDAIGGKAYALTLMLGIEIILFIIMKSFIEIHEYCNDQMMGYIGGEFEIRYENVGRMTAILYCATLIAIILTVLLVFIYL